MLKRYWIFLTIPLIYFGCSTSSSQKGETASNIFKLVDSTITNITFNNTIEEKIDQNILINNYIYNGAGVGTADFNNDGLPDIFFAGNFVDNQLYLNQGNLKFKNITEKAGIAGSDKWVSGVNVADINNDGWQDIYLTCTYHKDTVLRENILFINQGLDKDGNPTFIDEAKAFGLADNRYTTHSIFVDYDLDGDLDLFLINNKLDVQKTIGLPPKMNNGTSPSTDKLYQNNGNNTFTDVSTEAGITVHGFGLGVATFDANEDGYPDIYVSNDFITNDILWINQQNGTFKNEIMNYTDHQSFSSMGNNIGDFNNDGQPEIVTLDMLPDEDQRMKMMFGGSNHAYYELMQRKNYQIQYPRNTIQLNQGNGNFSDISMMLDIDATDWSWSPLICDFDNNGQNDLFITNGFPRDITDLDFSDFHSGMNVLMSTNERLLNKIPVVKIANHLYLQNGNLTFDKAHVGAEFSVPSFSNGGALVDLDKDGDMDMVVSNINDLPFVYQNQTIENQSEEQYNYIQIALEGSEKNRGAIGSKVTVYTAEKVLAQDAQFNRGYCSTSENLLHFGLGQTNKIDSIVVVWMDNSTSIYPNPKINQRLSYSYDEATKQSKLPKSTVQTVFQPVQNELTAKAHTFNKFYDFDIQPHLQKLASEEGPATVVADLDNNGTDDIILDMGEGQGLHFFYQKETGGFEEKTFSKVNFHGEIVDVLAVDINSDGFKDLYLAKGSPQNIQQPTLFKDEVYLSQNGEDFVKDLNFQASERISSTAVAADFDKDGDLDIFVGGRVVAGKWPNTPTSTLYRNDNGQLTNQTTALSKDLETIGMVTSAIWTDINNDDWLDLMVVGRWMSPTIFINKEGKRLEKTNFEGFDKLEGLWNSVVAADLDGDGFTDYVLGNQGLNNKYRYDEKHPLKLYAKDFDENGSIDPIVSHYINGEYRPYHLRNSLLKQLKTTLSKDYTNYKLYAESSTKSLLKKLDKKGMLTLEADRLDHIILWNEGGKAFKAQALPMSTQVSAGMGILLEDINGDKKVDILFTGNDYATEVFNGINDAGKGAVLMNSGERKFHSLSLMKSNFYHKGNTRGLVKYFDKMAGQFIYLTSRHGGTRIAHQQLGTPNYQKIIDVPNDIFKVVVQYKNGKKVVQELHLGQGCKSQNSRKMGVTDDIQKITGTTFKGKTTTIYSE